MFATLSGHVCRFWNDEDGATMVEYALMLALVVVVCMAAVSLVAQNTYNTHVSNANAITAAM